MRDNGIHFVQCADGTKRGVCGIAVFYASNGRKNRLLNPPLQDFDPTFCVVQGAGSPISQLDMIVKSLIDMLSSMSANGTRKTYPITSYLI